MPSHDYAWLLRYVTPGFRGDATDAAFVARCLDDGPAALVFTDPSYNVAYGAHGGRAPDAPARRLV